MLWKRAEQISTRTVGTGLETRRKGIEQRGQGKEPILAAMDMRRRATQSKRKEKSRFAAELRRIVLQRDCIELNGIGKEQPRTENALKSIAMEPKCGAKATVNSNRKEKLCRVD